MPFLNAVFNVQFRVSKEHFNRYRYYFAVTVCFQMLVTFLDDFRDEMSAYAQPTQLIFSGNIFDFMK